MRAIDLEDYNITLSKPKDMTDEQCMPLTAWHGPDHDGSHCFITAWVPNKEDLEALNAGRPLYLKIVGMGFPPVALFTLDEEGKGNG